MIIWISCRFRIRYIAFSSVKVLTNDLALEKCIRFFFYNEVLWYHYCGSSVVLVAQLCPTLCDPADCSPSVSCVHGILQARIVEWIAIPFSRGSSQPRDRTLVSCIAGKLFTIWAMGKTYHYWEEVKCFTRKIQKQVGILKIS